MRTLITITMMAVGMTFVSCQQQQQQQQVPPVQVLPVKK